MPAVITTLRTLSATEESGELGPAVHRHHFSMEADYISTPLWGHLLSVSIDMDVVIVELEKSR